MLGPKGEKHQKVNLTYCPCCGSHRIEYIIKVYITVPARLLDSSFFRGVGGGGLSNFETNRNKHQMQVLYNVK
jgi:hypothetical protein